MEYSLMEIRTFNKQLGVYCSDIAFLNKIVFEIGKKHRVSKVESDIPYKVSIHFEKPKNTWTTPYSDGLAADDLKNYLLEDGWVH